MVSGHKFVARARRLCVAVAFACAATNAWAQHADCTPGAACPSLDFTGGYTADFRRNTTGGLATGDAASGLLKLGAAWHTDRLFPGAFATVSVSAIHASGDAISGTYVGDLQGLNNIEADSGWYLYDFWTEFSFGSGQGTSVRAGLLDLNADFDTSPTAGFFISPPFGIGTDLAQTGENGPSIFPVTALGMRLTGQFSEALAWHVAAYDGVPGRTDRHSVVTVDASRDQGALLIGEVDFASPGVHKIAFGAWTYTADFERVDAAATGDVVRGGGNRGAYAMIDAPLGMLGAAHFDGMVRMGVADARYNAVGTYVGAAIVATHLLPGRPDDGIGLAVARARTGGPFRDQLAFDGGLPAKAETAVELTWRAPLTGWLAIVPSVQWVNTPGADHSLHDAFVAGFRFEMSYARSWPLLARQAGPAQDAPLVVSNQ